MKFLSRNTAGLNQPHKLHQTLRQARQMDVTFLQETKLQVSQTALVRSKWRSNHVFLSCADTSRRGVMTLIHPRNDPVHLHEINDPNGQFHILVTKIRDEIYLLVNVYADPDTDRNAEVTMMAVSTGIDNMVLGYPVQHIAVAGDFNFVMRDSDTNSQSRKPRAAAVLNTIVNTHDLYDISALQSISPAHTYFRHRNEGTSARYDRFHITTGLLQNSTYRILPRTGDHAPISFSTTLDRSQRAWKFSDNHLGSPAFVAGLHNCIRQALSDYVDTNDSSLENMQTHINYDIQNSSAIFTTLIRKIRKYAVDESRKISSENKRKEDQLITNLIAARNQANSVSPPTADQLNNLEAAQQALMMSQTKRVQSASTSNQINYSGFGERMSRYHFARVGRGKASREITNLVVSNENGAASLNRTEIPTFMFDKYAEIVKEDPLAGTVSIQEFLGHDLLQTLRLCPEEDKEALISPVLAVEIKNIVKDLKPISAPGPLGLTNNLMKEILPFMIEILVDLGNQIFFSDNPPEIDPFLFHRLVIFILKPGKPCTDPDSYRGLSLLEGFFKIYSKTLANRIQKPMRHIQSNQQFGFTRDKGVLEASRTVLDVAQHSIRTGLPLIIISTDFKKAFDSISLNHIEACLDIYQFPPEFRTAFMRLVRNGTMSFQVNSSTSQDYELQCGSGQGDPKSSFAYNLAAAPLNHFLSTSPSVPRYEVDGVGTEPVFFADDDLMLLQGDKIDLIIQMLEKMGQYRLVSGLIISLIKCEIMAFNCREEDIQRLVTVTRMKRVTTLKHLGLRINNNGELTHADNIEPIQTAMDNIADSMTTTTCTPLGRSIYAKYLLSSLYLHKIQNFSFTQIQLSNLRNTILKLTWTRHRVGTDSSSTRTHIASDRVAQPLSMGGLSVPDPLIQSQALKFSWVRKMVSPDTSLVWVRLLEHNLGEIRRPNLSTHLQLGSMEWVETSQLLSNISPFWSQVFLAISQFMILSHRFDKAWHLIPITGNENSDFNHINIGSLAYRNPVVKEMTDAGLFSFGQLFTPNQVGVININNMKDFAQIEIEFNIIISPPVRNSILGLVNRIRICYRSDPSTPTPEAITTIQSLVRAHSSGCQVATKLLLKQQRQEWSWGEFPRSYSTYLDEGLVSITPSQFSQSLCRTRRTLLPPAVQWTSIQCHIRTLWTNVKEQRTTRNLLSANPVTNLCSNCQTNPENTVHLIYECLLAQQMWECVTDCFNQSIINQDGGTIPIALSRDNIMFNYPPNDISEEQKYDIIDIVMVVKHAIYRLKFRENIDAMPSIRLLMVIVTMDLEKAVTVRNYMNKDSFLLAEVTDKIKLRAGF